MKFFKNFFVFFLVFSLLALVNCEVKKSKLDKKVAKKMIVKAYQNPIALRITMGEFRNIITFQTNRRGMSWTDLKWRDSQVKEGKSYVWLKSLSDRGIITFSCTAPVVLRGGYEKEVKVTWGKDTMYLADILYVVKINLTETSKNYVLKEENKEIKIGLGLGVGMGHLMQERIKGEYKIIYLRLCDSVITKINGIRILDKNNAIVEYEWKYDNFTPIGEILINSKYDIDIVNQGILSDNYGVRLDKENHRGKSKFVLYDDGWRMKY